MTLASGIYVGWVAAGLAFFIAILLFLGEFYSTLKYHEILANTPNTGKDSFFVYSCENQFAKYVSRTS